MKVKITTLVLCLMLSIFMTAQQKNDSFFNYSYENAGRAIYTDPVPIQTDMGMTFQNMNVNAPVGNGLIIMLGISIFYVIIKRKDLVR
ncbi:MAG: hypothetical protein IJZ87_09820 [Bacteroidales bacterium]|nr:hypothetical protein [Bacteroidales bacterium]